MYEYPKNSRAETYGSEVHAVEAGGKPDLISVIGDDHRTRGYVLKTDFESRALPKNLEEVEARAASGQTERVGDKEVPLYAQDGVTVIGTFTLPGWAVGGGNGRTPPPRPEGQHRTPARRMP